MNKKERFEELVSLYFDNSLSKEEHAELGGILLGSKEARILLAEYAKSHVEMTIALGVELPELKKPAVRKSLKMQMVTWGSIAALLILGFSFFNILSDNNQFVVLRNGTKSESVSKPPAETECLARKGCVMTTAKGNKFEFLSSSVFSMIPAKDKKERDTIKILSGEVRITVSADSAGIRAITPEGELRDIGTEFEVGVKYNKDEDIMLEQLRLKNIRPIVTALVLSGIVEFQSDAAGSPPLKITRDMGKIELSADFSLGKVLDREGSALIKPCNATRWSIADEKMLIEAKDWIKTGKRGANALLLRMKNDVRLILGPDTLIEVIDAANIKLFRGELEVKAPGNVTIKIKGPDGKIQKVSNQISVMRARKNKMTLLKEVPAWLKGYKNNQSTEAMGSLLANVDGRNVPLTIGYHKVTVDIRDQIARTVVEESFVNHTSSILEGVFYFPLPQDASISGFGMWIGDELVHGEIVEKERAREIYETILREKRDPGLLEWSGGNIFKARVYPIGGEKRIKITYTQVLPKIGDSYSYNYSLQSEMLKLHPLKKLQITVNVNSAEPLASAISTSHPCRTDMTKNSAKIEFEAEEYTPERDFEVKIKTAGDGQQVTLIPHRRADDGYLMLMVNAPPSEQKVTRDLLQKRKPMKFIIMADTSGSVNGTQRESMLSFTESLLNSLGDEDVFNLMTFDVEPRWVSDTMLKNNSDNRKNAVQFVEKRYPLGWSDLDAAFASVFERVDKDTVVIFAGDGIITTGACDPQSFCKRLKQSYPGVGSFHAVAPGSTYESSVLKTIASFDGSWRAIHGGTDPAKAAYEVLKQATTPAIRDLKVKFEGVDVAAVYPEELPNLPVGTQQIILGRYNPEKGDAKGKVTVTGTLDGKPVSYSSEIILAGAEKGNSFIPRLWARKHLDSLLNQGRSPNIKNQIITLSEDYQIITPYTSFLVLESDADRERFAVKKSFRMRDGEDFFAKGRENANYELIRKQMLRAKKWRLRLAYDMRKRIADLGHNIMPQMPIISRGDLAGASSSFGPISRGFGGGGGGGFEKYGNLLFLDGHVQGYAGSAWNGRRKEEIAANLIDYCDAPKSPDFGLNGGDSESFWTEDEKSDKSFMDFSGDDLSKDMDSDGMPPMADPMPTEESVDYEMDEKIISPVVSKSEKRLEWNAPQAAAEPNYFYRESARRISSFGGRAKEERYGGYYCNEINLDMLRRRVPNNYNSLFNLFPQISGNVSVPIPDKIPADIAKLLTRINHRKMIISENSAFEIEVESFSRDRYGKEIQSGTSLHLLSHDKWLEKSSHIKGNAYNINWLFDKERGVVNATLLLGCTRKAAVNDNNAWNAPFQWFFGDAMRSYYSYTITKEEKPGENQVYLTLTHPANKDYKVILVIDPKLSVIREVRTIAKENKVTSRVIFKDFKEIAGVYWPTLIENTDKDGKITYEQKISVRAVNSQNFEKKISGMVEDYKEKSIILKEGKITLEEARQAVKDKTAKFADYLLLLDYYLIAKQQKELAEPHFRAIEKMFSSKWGLNRIRIQVLQLSRRLEEGKKDLMKLAENLSADPRDTEISIANEIINLSYNFNQGNERKLLLEAIKPVYERGTGPAKMLNWENNMISALQNMGRQDEVFKWRKMMARKYPDNYNVQVQYANQLANRGETDKAVASLKKSLESKIPWQNYEIKQLNQTIINILYNARRLQDVIRYIDTVAKDKPENIDEYQWNSYLSALIMLGRDDEAAKLEKQWLGELKEKDFSVESRAKYNAAVKHAMGQGRDMYHNRIDEDMAELLAKTAESLVDYDKDFYLAGRILNNYQFRRTAQGIEFYRRLFLKLKTNVSDMPPARLQQYVQWLKGCGVNDLSEEPVKDWNRIFETVFQRWQKRDVPNDKNIFEQIVMSYGELDLKIKLARIKLKESKTDAEKAQSAQTLFNLLLLKQWDEKIMEEMFSLLPLTNMKVDMTSMSDEQIMIQKERANASLVINFLKLSDWIVISKANAEIQAIPDLNSLPRRKLKEAREKAMKNSRTHAIEILQNREQSIEPKLLAEWVTIERIYNQLKLKPKETQIQENELMTLLNSLIEESDGKKAEEITSASAAMAGRIVTMLSYLELKKKPAKIADSNFLVLINKLIENDNKLLDWQYVKYQLLVALDLGDELEKCLAKWYGSEKKFAKLRWGNNLAQIYAERNKIKDAVRIYEDLEKLNALSQQDFRTLADWYMVLDHREKMNEAKIKSWQQQDEWRIANWIQNQTSRYRRRGDNIPEEMDPEVPLALIALFRKSINPQSHIYVLRYLYETTRDFRVLECLPEAVIGQTSQKIYPFLQGFNQVTSLLQEEATLDRLKKHLHTVRAKCKTKTDERALLLLEFLVEYRAATQSNGAGPHTDAALKAMQKAFDGKWEEGEPVLMAEFLANQGALRPDKLLKEQLRELRILQESAEPGTFSYLRISGYYARILWSNQRDKAIRVLEGALNAYRNANDGILPQDANSYLSTLSGYYSSQGQFMKAEKMWLHELSLDRTQQQINWLKTSLYSLYYTCITHKGEVSLGKGLKLYRAVHRMILEELNTVPNESTARSFISTLCSIWEHCFRTLKYNEVKKDIREFAFNKLPEILNRFNYRNGQYMIQNVESNLENICGNLTALEFLIVRAENEPKWLRLQNQNFWQQHGSRVAYLRHGIGKKLPEILSERLLVLVLVELREELRAIGNSYSFRNIYWKNHSYYWNEKEDDFVRTASEVLKKYQNSGPRVKYIANYFFNGLYRYDLAIDALFAAYRKGILDIDGRYRLCDYLHSQKRWKESIPLLKELIELQPNPVRYRTMLMRAAFRTGQKDMLNKTLRDAEKYYREKKLWHEGNIAALARECLACELLEEAVKYYDEAIALHVKTHANRGIGNGILSEYYRRLGETYSKLKRTDDAVDAASGAIISWGNHIHNRQDMLNNLENILFNAEDLDAFVERFSAKVEKTGLENPILRRALGSVYYKKKKYEQAAYQLQEAIAAQPNDVKTHRLLIQTYDNMKREDKATEQLLKALLLSGHDISLYKELAARYHKLEQTASEERAQTGMVEMLPSESESHQALAELLEKQNRYADAEIQWEQVKRIRSKEPTGYMGLAKNLIKQEKYDEARKVLHKLISTSWPKRFGDIHRKAENLLKKLK